MEISKEEFEETFQEAINSLLEDMAENPAIELEKFYSMACFLENIALFSPVLYGALRQSRNKKGKT